MTDAGRGADGKALALALRAVYLFHVCGYGFQRMIGGA